VDLGQAFELSPSEHLVPCIRTRCRIQDKRAMFEMYPWASPVDLMFFLEGWDKGVEFAHRLACNELTVPDSPIDSSHT